MNDYKQNYIEKMKEYLYSVPKIEVRGDTYLNVDIINNSIIDCENTVDSRYDNYDIISYTNDLSLLLPLYNNSETLQEILEIDDLLRNPNHIRALSIFSQQQLNFDKLKQDIESVKTNKVSLKKISRTLARDAYVVKILKFTYEINALISSCLTLGGNEMIINDKFDARMLVNTRAQEMIYNAFSNDEMPFKYLINNYEIADNQIHFSLDEYLQNKYENIRTNFVNTTQNKNEENIHKALEKLKLQVSELYTNLNYTINKIDKSLQAITATK